MTVVKGKGKLSGGAEPLNGGGERLQRVLVVDDNSAIHLDIRKILSPSDTALDDIEAALFGDEPVAKERIVFEVDCAFDGPAGLEMVQQAVRESRPYGLAFIDLHMPPGWDGLETISRIWQVDSDIQIVLCTALLDCSWNEVVARLGRSEGLAILKKPFEPGEVLHLADAMTDNWWSHRKVRHRLSP
jgi:two-component system, NtrC family, sensor kinase